MKTNDSNISTYEEILMGDRDEKIIWDVAMLKELKCIANVGSFEIVNRSRRSNMLQSTLAFKRKRYADGELKICKDKLYVRGDQQIEGVDVFDIYAPVVSWIMVRLLLEVSILFSISTQQMNCIHAIYQAPLEKLYSSI